MTKEHESAVKAVSNALSRINRKYVFVSKQRDMYSRMIEILANQYGITDERLDAVRMRAQKEIDP